MRRLKVLTAVILMTALAPTALADGHGVIPPTGDPVADFWTETWVDPKIVTYRICWRSFRTNYAADGSSSETPLNDWCWQPLDYPSWLVAERMVLEVPAAILEAWGHAVGDASPATRAMLGKTEFWGGP